MTFTEEEIADMEADDGRERLMPLHIRQSLARTMRKQNAAEIRMDEPFMVRKIGYTVPMSCCMARDYGMDVECNHPPLPKPSRRTRLRWWLADRWDRRPRVHFGPCDHEDCR